MRMRQIMGGGPSVSSLIQSTHPWGCDILDYGWMRTSRKFNPRIHEDATQTSHWVFLPSANSIHASMRMRRDIRGVPRILSGNSIHASMRMRPQYMVIIGGTRTKYRDPLYCHVLQMIIHCHISCTFHHIEVRKTRGFHVHLPFAPGRSQWLCACYIFHSTTDFTKMGFHLNLLQHLIDAAISPLQLRAVSPIPQQIISRSTLPHPFPEIIVN